MQRDGIRHPVTSVNYGYHELIIILWYYVILCQLLCICQDLLQVTYKAAHLVMRLYLI